MGVAIGWFACAGWTVCVPLTDSQPYDLVVDAGDGVLCRVSVRTSTQRQPKGQYEVGLRTQGGNHTQRAKVRHFDPAIVDILFVACDDGTKYLIPSAAITNRSSLTVGGSKYNEFQVGVVSTAEHVSLPN